MILLSAKEAYALFLESQWWRELAERKKRQAGCCERCKFPSGLQAHHRIYREHWFDTRLEDLECLCERCHAQEHGIKPASRGVSTPKPTVFSTLDELERARSERLISRPDYLESKRSLSGKSGFRKPRRGRKRRRSAGVKTWNQWSSRQRRLSKERQAWVSSAKPLPPPQPRRVAWVSRGNSSN